MIATQQARRRAAVNRRPQPAGTPLPPQLDIVPFDHAARFELTGVPGHVVQDVISLSTDGIFVAVAIAYGLEAADPESVPLVRNDQGAGVVPGDVTLGELPASALIEGFRFNPAFERVIFRGDQSPPARARGARLDRDLNDDPLAPANVIGGGDRLLFNRTGGRRDFSFLFSITDTASGRELQDEPLHNLASLGRSDGERPFRLLSKPVTFLPRSTIRLQVIEQSDGVRGTLFIVFHGYKVMTAGCAEPVVRRFRGPASCPVEVIGRPDQRVIPFDYVTTFPLTGTSGRVIEDEVAIGVDGSFVATALGYGLEAESPRVPIEWERVDEIRGNALRNLVEPVRRARDAWEALPGANPAKAAIPAFDLNVLPVRMLPVRALVDGVRIRPDYIRVAMTDGGVLTNACPVSMIDDLFERLCGPDRVSFRYSITDTGRGLELQNQPLHNIAGLGAADGRRPFKKLLRPLVCLPRSTIRVRVEERAGRGTLFIVFQGYKLLGGSAPEGGR